MPVTKELNDRAGFWGLKLYRSYKESARGMFKGFIEDIGESNSGFAWDWNEDRLKGLSIGAVIGEEEYIGNDGNVKTRYTFPRLKSAQDIRDGNFRVPELKTLDGGSSTPASGTGQDAQAAADPYDDIPFSV